MSAHRAHPPFLRTIFDLSFTTFVAPRLIPIGFVVGLVVLALYAAGIASVAGNGAATAFGSGAGPIASVLTFVAVFLAGALALRIQLEVVAVAFRVLEHVARPDEGPVD